MKAKNVTEQEMEKALEIVNQKYNNNIIFNRFEKNGRGFRFTLKCVSSSSEGARIGFTGRKMVSACWHVHGDFFDALLSIQPLAVIKSGNTRPKPNNQH